MLRIFIVELALFLSPFAVFALVLLARRALGRKTFMEGPLAWLALSGLVLALAGFLVLGFLEQQRPSGRYVPAQYIDGHFVPGHFE